MPPPSTTKKRPKSKGPASTRDGTELLEGELYLDNLEMDDKHWGKMVKWAYKHPDRVLSPSEVPEAERPRPNVKIARDTLDKFCSMINERLPGIPGNTVTNLVKVFSGSDLINAVNPDDIYSMELPTANAMAGFIPVPDMARFNPKEPFEGQTCWTYGVAHGTTVSAAVSILLEGIIRPSDWDHHSDPKKSAFPNFGLGMGIAMPNRDTELPHWLVKQLTDRAAKRGKGQQPILVGAIYRGKYEHVAFKAGGNDKVQIQVAKRGVSTSSEKYTVVHSANTQVRFIAVTWDSIPQDHDLRSEDSDDVTYRSSARNWRPPHERSD